MSISSMVYLLGDPHEQGLVFKWGSLVGVSLPTTGASNTSPFVAGDVEFTPAGFTSTITNDWATVPYCEIDFPPYGNTATDHLSQAHNPATGVGDICRYMGVVDSINWRMPTAVEWAELYWEREATGEARRIGEEWVDGSFYRLSGLVMGPRRANVAIDESLGETSPLVTNADPYVNGAVFLSANGLREAEIGAIWWIGSCGFYWSSTALTTGNGYNIEFNSSNVWPQNPASRRWARSIRCIRE